jgi:RNA polymerase-binding transcription factor DksA
MTKRKLETHRKRLRNLAARLGGDISALEDQARTPTGGQAVGNLSNAPMHLGDMGTEVYLQELNATLLENQEYLRGEVMAAMERIEAGTYGACESCGKKIIEERLDLLPYARHCTSCAEALQSGRDINLNEGRPRDAADLYHPYDARAEAQITGTDYTSKDISIDGGVLTGASRRSKQGDIHAAGTAAGGMAEGGLAGTNVGEGEPDNADLEDAMGSGTHDVAIEEDDEDTVAYSGRSGGAVGGTPPGKRSVGGKKRRGGIVPSEDPDRAESG